MTEPNDYYVLWQQAQTEARQVRAGLLTDDEHRAIELAGKLWNLLSTRVIGNGSTGPGDRRELAAHIHSIQHMVMSQAAARAYPNLYRELGDILRPN